MKKLYLCDVSVQIVVAAHNEADALNSVENYAAKELRQTGANLIEVNEIENASEIPSFWLDCIPWGQGKSERQCQEYFE